MRVRSRLDASPPLHIKVDSKKTNITKIAFPPFSVEKNFKSCINFSRWHSWKEWQPINGRYGGGSQLLRIWQPKRV
jgi:hypothetical protein